MDLPKEFYNRRAGVFITIKKVKSYSEPILRGCIGTYLPCKKNIADEIISNAISAATRDWRFSPIRQEEFPELNYEVSILSEPEQIENIENPTKFSEEKFRQAGLNPKKYGILVKTLNGRSGLLLPNLEKIDTVVKQISVACQKGGINPESDKIILYKFTVEKYED